MSLFSGMKISGGKGETNKDDSKPRKEQKECNEQSISAFGFIRDTQRSKDKAISQTLVDDPDSCQEFHPSHPSPDVVNEIDLDVDFELDPLTPCFDQSRGRASKGTDLEGIDFSKDVEALLDECNINVKSDDPVCKEDTFQDDARRLDSDLEIKQDHRDLDMKSSSNETQGMNEKELDTYDDHIKCSAIPDGCHVSAEHSSSSLDAVGAKNPDEGSSSLYNIELDLQDTLEVLLESHAASEQQLRLEEEALSEELDNLGKERLWTMYSMIKKQSRLDELQALQSQAINDENYEQAEIMTKECSSLEKDLCSIPQVTLDNAVDDIFSSRSTIYEKKKRQRSEWILAIKDLQNQQEVIISKMKEGRRGDPEANKLKLDMQKTELERAMGHVLLDKNHVERREAQLWSRIDEKTADLRDTKDKLSLQKTTVQDEIAALEEQLCKLRSEEERISCEIDKQEEAIDEVKGEFSEEILIIEEEKMNVQDREDRLTKDRMALDENEKMLSAEMNAFDEALAREEDLMSRIVLSENTISSLNQDREKEDNGFSIPDCSLDLEPTSNITSLREKVMSNTEDMQATSAKILTDKARLATLKKKVTDTEDHIVTLQEAKHFAVSMRKFGEAKHLTEEIKIKMDEGHSHQTQVESVSEELKNQQTTLNNQQDQVVKLKIELAKEEKKWELQLCERAKTMMATISTVLQDTETMKSTLSTRKLEIEKQSCALLIGWLSRRHGLQDMPEVLAVLEEFKDNEGMDIGDEVKESHQPKTLASATESKFSEELQELEENLQKAIEAEDYDMAEHIQERIESLQSQQTDAR
ncbi:cytadherence high molecular weight protein 2-like isoform X2 [Lytechinus variegatus]|uniref:cytadherence high molecular weight protein 2-like isoform X2 n=1 Tax=Lytechinus variegatus TaxID=7654 RepID=UPI001BB1ECFD|nr:cytadherence high molecular weight protein 2-like isoform X2 [Lytechinus variegatus]